jgi:hypothetical protein
MVDRRVRPNGSCVPQDSECPPIISCNTTRRIGWYLDLTIILAVVGAAILLSSSLVVFVALGLVAIGIAILRDNVRGLRRGG